VLEPTGLAIADINADGELDLVSSSATDAKIAWYPGGGDGTFGAQQVVTTGAIGAQDVIVADLDNDGLEDVVYCSSTDGRVRWSRNSGGGFFASLQTLGSACDGAFRIAAGDFDADGDMDIACSCPGGMESQIYENVGFGFFAAPVSLEGDKSGGAICEFLDIDGDLDLDVISSVGVAPQGLVLNSNQRTIGSTYCASTPNSSGSEGILSITGTAIAERNTIALTANDLSMNSFGYFLTSRTQGMTSNPAGSEGILCLGGSVGRYVGPGQIRFSGASQSIRIYLDKDSVPQPLGFVSFLPGETWNFQAWHRDTVNGTPTSNFTDAVSLNIQ
jgi:hypothetical protein